MKHYKDISIKSTSSKIKPVATREEVIGRNVNASFQETIESPRRYYESFGVVEKYEPRAQSGVTFTLQDNQFDVYNRD